MARADQRKKIEGKLFFNCVRNNQSSWKYRSEEETEHILRILEGIKTVFSMVKPGSNIASTRMILKLNSSFLREWVRNINPKVEMAYLNITYSIWEMLSN